MLFNWQTSCQQLFETETGHVTSWFLFLENCVPQNIFSSFLLLLETDQVERWHVTTTHINASLVRAKCRKR